MFSVRLSAVLAATVAVVASAALVLPGQASARENLDCGFNRAMAAQAKGWPNAPHYKHCGDKPVLLLLENALKKGNVCSPPHKPHEGLELRPIKNDQGEEFYEVMSAKVVGDCGGVG
ncbi:hypothetical protein NLX83_32645 [Allokutzneria sp. A3M-2-11 16]|uniref:hypothetical protein n=1 Tax=Allokutzneria sp. A3M-2-11 16 TaxID=2962043 RepID=UPI0020B68A13|nr:hypothetical protein [Allokutzneria sp. A3M-2-11 16]MCP3804030.1 hypothetical protein [Allokutzneria sp. A3M-2-11 16]